MPSRAEGRSRPVGAAEVRAYGAKAEEYLAASCGELAAGRLIAATSLAIHAAINAADAVCGARVGRRAAGEAHTEVLALLRESGVDGAEVARHLERLLPLKTRAEYEPDGISSSTASRAIEPARRCVAVARRLAGAAPPPGD